MKILKTCSFLVISIVGFAVSAQTKISLDEAIQMAKSGNHSVLLANQAVAVQQAMFEQTKGHFRPYVGMEMTDIATNNPLNVFGFKLLQESVKQTDFNPELLNDPGVRNQFNLTLNTMMPLYNPEARVEQEAVRSQIKMKEAISHRTTQGIELEVVKSYYILLLSQHVVHVLEDTYSAAQANYDISNNYYEQGLLLKSDLLDMQVMVNQSELALATATKNVANAQAHFNHVLNTEKYTDFVPTDSLVDIHEFKAINGELNSERSDFLAMHHGIDAMELMSKAANKSFLPTVKAFGSLSLNDEIPFENNASNFQVGLTMSWDIYKGNSIKSAVNKINTEIIEKEIELDQKRKSAKLEISQTQREIQHIKKQIELHDLSIAQAKEALKIRKNRFEQGLEKSTDMINAETQLSHKKLARLNSLFELNMKNAYLNFLLN